MPKQKNNKKTGSLLYSLLLIAIFTVIGYITATFNFGTSADDGFVSFIAVYLLHILLIFLAYYIQIIIHEAGHLAAGLLSGYRFSSFRIFSLMLIKRSEGFSFKRFTLAGTGGQCLMCPPDKKPDGTYPYKFYNLGGILLNMISSVLFFTLFYFTSGKNFGREFLLLLALWGLFSTVQNGIPVCVNGIGTDGYNVVHIEKEPFALDSLWLQLKINEMQVDGKRLKDMPEEWFVIPDDASKENSIVSTIAVFSENRSMDELDFSTAKQKISVLENTDEYSVIGLYQNLLLLDRITIDLTENGENADTSKLNDKQIKAFLKTMANYPAVMRTQYGIKLLKEKNPAEAKIIRDRFNSVARRYPFISDIESESEIMNYLDSFSD